MDKVAVLFALVIAVNVELLDTLNGQLFMLELELVRVLGKFL